MTLTQNFEHDGTTYRANAVTIKETFIGFEDHGIFTATLYLEGGYGGALPLLMGDAFHARFADYLQQIMKVTGVRQWEEQKGKQVLMLSEGNMIAGIASLDGERHFLQREFLAEINKEKVDA